MAVPFTVQSVRPITRVDSQGNLQEYYEIWFTTESKQSSYVRVPQSASKDDILRAVSEAAAKIEAIMQVSG
jgi:hypothetical protein